MTANTVRSARPLLLLVAMALFQCAGLLFYASLLPDPDWRLFGGLIVYSALVAALLCLIPAHRVGRLRAKLRAFVADERRFRFALVGGLTLPLLFYMSLLPLWLDEQANFEVIRSILADGVFDFFANYGDYRWLGVQHPPLAPLIYSASGWLFGLTPLAVRLPNLLFASIALLATYEIGKLLLDRESAVTAAVLLPAFPLVARMMAIANNDLLVVTSMILAVLAALRLAQRPTMGRAVALGLAIGVGMVAKYTMVFAYPVVLGIVLFQRRERALAPLLASALAVSAILPGAWLVFQSATGLFDRQFETLLFYAGLAPEPADFDVPGSTDVNGTLLRINWLTKHLPLGFGVYNIPVLWAGLLFAVRSWGRSTQASARASTRGLSLWAAVIVLPVLALLPQPRYFLPAFPALALLTAGGLASIAGERTRPTVLALCYCPVWLILYDLIERHITL